MQTAVHMKKFKELDRQSRGYLTHAELKEFKQTIQVISRVAKGYRQIVTFSDIDLTPNNVMAPLHDVGDFFRSAAVAAVNIYKPSANSSSDAASSSRTPSTASPSHKQSAFSKNPLEDIV